MTDNIQQQVRSRNEFKARSQYAMQNSIVQNAGIEDLHGDLGAATLVQADPMVPKFISDELMLTRKAVISGEEHLQGCWLDWPALRGELLQAIRDLLPNASLEPAPAGDARQQERLLASLPIRLDSGALGVDLVDSPSAIRWSLAVAWLCLSLAALAIGWVLGSVLSLSERRAAFVSAVTHELRTPLTTFRMYSEMLASGMVPNEQNRARYLSTLCVEADRLTHLVENVLAYARLERGGLGGRLQDVPVSELIERASDRLADRVDQAGMRLEVQVPEHVGEVIVRTDSSAVEQIIFNLVDNASKYANSASDRRICVNAEVAGAKALVRVRDHGPGISSTEGKRLFQPFRKSARDAAHSAPGIGLGLALSRRLARDMNGDLALEASDTPGASFVLTLPLAK